MSAFQRFNKIFIFFIFIIIFVVFIIINISGCGNKSDDAIKANAYIDPDLIYYEEPEFSIEVISGTMAYFQTEKPQETEITTTEEPTEITETTEDINNITELYVITPSGKKYHYQDCRTVANIKQYLTKEEADKLGYEPCKICNPK